MVKSLVNRDNYIVVQGWMITDLKLKGNDLLVYACIYGFSQLEGQEFTGSRKYLAEWTNSTVNGVAKNLRSLVERGLIVKKEDFVNGVKFCRYATTKFTGGEQSSLGVGNSVTGGRQQSLLGVGNSVTGGKEHSCPNNIDNNINNNLVNNIGERDRAHTHTKYPFGKYKNVLLTDVEYEQLTEVHGAILRDELIEFLDSYIQDKGYDSNSHFEALGRWVIDAVNERKLKRTKQTPNQQPKGRQYNMDAMERMMLKAQEPTPTAGNNPAIRARAEELQQRLSS